MMPFSIRIFVRGAKPYWFARSRLHGMRGVAMRRNSWIRRQSGWEWGDDTRCHDLRWVSNITQTNCSLDISLGRKGKIQQIMQEVQNYFENCDFVLRSTMDMGAVAGLRRVKGAISVAKKVLQHTKHSLLGGDLASEFAIKMGHKEESLATQNSTDVYLRWKDKNKCQPNFWKVVG